MPDGFLTAGRTLNIAHRGASAVAPENTLAAFEKAAQLGADGIELDVRLCADGVPVVIHDASVDATTDGSGRVAGMTLAELKQLDAGSWFGPAFAGERIPTLAETVATVGDQLLLNFELKGEGLVDRGLVRAVVDLVEHHRLAERVLVSSFNPLALRHVQEIAPQIITGMLYTIRARLALARLVSARPYTAMHPHARTLDEGHMNWIQEHNHRIHVWTVDDSSEMRRLVEWGVDGIMTNVPDRLRTVLEVAS
ncbi:MAG: glycerophosphodiester phosphodiesterase family protein [Chloroflexota bacterium]|nr:glycerophosphodiester phosphodiesterase family protein [Chloroflexota bacterium]